MKKLDEDDEFEDFPQDEWQDIETQTGSHETKLWEENWEDHDEYKDDFTSKLRYVYQQYPAFQGEKQEPDTN